MGLLRRYLEAGQVPAGLLFHGEEGVGKETAALAFSAALLCRSPSGGDACGECPDCRLFGAGSHPNFLRVGPENLSIPIDGIRRLQEELSLKSFSDRPRIALIHPADRMTIQAANALLKTLEEPPPSSHLLLVAHRISRLPVTIVSRCQKVPFGPLPTALVETVLSSRPRDGGRRSPEAVRRAAACSGGSPGRALAALDEGEDERNAWLDLFTSFSPGKIFEAAKGWKGGGEIGPRIAAPLSLLRDIALLSSGEKEDIMNEDLGPVLATLAGSRSADEWTRAFQALLSMSRTPPQLQKSLMLEAFLFEWFGKG
ncbi:MAG: DNA polymerase III subunit delta' [Deltaproteobacteria bacterium]